MYGQTSDTVMAGQCAALNVGHWDHRMIRRGDVLTVPGYFSPEQWYLCSLRLLPREKLLLKSGAEVKFHTGTSDVAAMFYPLRGTHMEGGASGLIQIKTKTPMVAGPGDHFLLRTSSPVRTIGGGLIIEAIERRLKGSRAATSARTCTSEPRLFSTNAASSSTACAGRSHLQLRKRRLLCARRFLTSVCKKSWLISAANRSSCLGRRNIIFIGTRPQRPARNFWN